MTAHHFICYSTAEALDFALKLADDLQAGPPSYAVWLDKRMIPLGVDWDIPIKEAIQSCASLLYLMTPDSVEDASECKNEWVRALSYKKAVIPLRLNREVQLPFRLGSRQWVDFTGEYAPALARLRQHLHWLSTPAGELQVMKDRLADAKRSLRRAADETEQKRIQEEISQLSEDIHRQQEIVDHPQQAQQRTERSIEAGIQREREPAEPTRAKSLTKFINPPPRLAPSYFQDRYRETRIIADFLRNDVKRSLTIVGRGGNGKTVLACRLLKALERGQLPDELGEFHPGGIVYLSARGTRELRFPHLYADLSMLAPPAEQERLEAIYKDPKASVRQQLAALLATLPPATILLLDNLEDVQDTETGDLTDAELDQALRTLLTLPSHSLKVILTTRVPPRNLMLMEPAHQAHLPLDQGLDPQYAENMLRELDADGLVGLKNAPEAALNAACERTQGNPRALEHLYNILAVDREATLEQILANTRAMLPAAVIEVLVGEAFNRLDRSAQLALQALAVYAHPVTATAVDYLLQPYLPAVDSASVLNRLVNRQFVRRDTGRYSLHQIDREYALGRIPTEAPAEQDASAGPPFTRHALWERAADYFKQIRLPREQWKKLEDLEAQLVEIELRCAAGDYDTAAGVLVEIDYDHLFLWGHYRLLVGQYLGLVGEIQDKELKGACLIGLGNACNSLGEVRKAIEHYEQVLAIAKETYDRESEGGALIGLGNAWYELGDVRKAIECHEQALGIGKEIGDRRSEGMVLGNLGNAYYSLGEVRKAIEYYEQALAIAKEIGDRPSKGMVLGNLGNAWYELGDVRKAIEYHEQALGIDKETGNRRSEGMVLGNLGNIWYELGDVRKAIEYHEQALGIDKEIGDRRGEAADLGNLGNAWSDLGEVYKAIEFQEQTLAIAHLLTDPYIEAGALTNLAILYLDQAELRQALQHFREAQKIGDAIVRPERQIESRQGLALVHLLLGNYAAAGEAAQAAMAFDSPMLAYRSPVLAGLALLRRGEQDAARGAFTEGVRLADGLLSKTENLYNALDYKALALCGLALCGEPASLPSAIEAFRAARRLTHAPGIVKRMLTLLDVLAEAAEPGQLAEARRAAAGEMA